MSKNLYQNPFLNASDYAIPKHCSLYRAARYIAFEERPVLPKFENEIYGFREFNLLLPERLLSSEDKLFYDAARALLVYLKNGQLSCSAFMVRDGKNDDGGFGNILGCDIEVAKEEWDDLAQIDWNKSELNTYKSYLENYKIYEKIGIDTSSLLKEFPLSKTKKKNQNKGRKEKYDWKKQIYPEIMNYFYEGADIEKSGEHHAKELWSICSQKFGEGNTPPIETLRTEAIAPILRRFRLEEN